MNFPSYENPNFLRRRRVHAIRRNAYFDWPRIKDCICNVPHQSPVNIATDDAIVVEYLPSLNTSGFGCLRDIPFTMKVTNSTVRLDPLSNRLCCITGGPCLQDKYILDHIHFHWGDGDCEGSEHTIDNKYYSAECHLVNYNHKYSNVNSARNHKDGLAVIALLASLNDPQQQEQEQRQMSFFSEAMDNLFCLKSPNVIGVQLNFQTTLYQLANLDRYQWYSYSGSLTTPPYSESVTWILFPDQFTVTSDQLACLRSIKPANIRSLQDLNSRKLIKKY